jgi:hypothetical protein
MTTRQKWMTGVAITGASAALAAVVILWTLFAAISR